MLKSQLFRRFFYLIIATVVGLTAHIYFFTVPYLKNKIYNIEEHTAQTVINNVGDLVQANFLAIEAYEKSVRKAHETQLKNITLFEETFLANRYRQFEQGLMSEEEAKFTALEELREFRYGNNDYVWVADLSGQYLSHPDPQMHLADFSQVKDIFGNYILTPLIDKALQKGEGYHTYWWQRLGKDLPAEKLSYARLFPQWEMIIGTGVFLDDLTAEVVMRKEKMIEELRAILNHIISGLDGDIFIFDGFDNIIIHRDRKLENTKLTSLINPSSGKPISQDLIAASRTPDKKLYYLWDSPDDPGHFVYDRIAWVKFIEGFDWYIVFTVDTQTLNASSINLRNKILSVSALVGLFSILLVTFLIGRLIRPIRLLSDTAKRIEDGDLSAQCAVTSRDEIGFLAASFNSMVGRLRSNIENLDRKVLERTSELDEKNDRLEKEIGERRKMQEQVGQANKKLTAWVTKLEHHNREITLLNRMAELLQACHALPETYPIVSETLHELFPRSTGGLFMSQNNASFEQVTAWGDYPDKVILTPDNCWGLKLGKLHLVQAPGGGQTCGHIELQESFISICLPLIGLGETLGMLHLLFIGAATDIQPTEEREQILESHQQLFTAVGDHLAMALANLKLRDKLHNLSVRDALTGLYNRRFMEETLFREFQKANRNRSFTGVIMLDVDLFKNFNDTYGHETGDRVLVELAKLLRGQVRAEDVVCRFGGEEFIIILPDSALEMVAKRAELIRRKVEEDLRLAYQGHSLAVTISLGVAIFPQHGDTQDDVLKAVDIALYQAKADGRNRVVIAD